MKCQKTLHDNRRLESSSNFVNEGLEADFQPFVSALPCSITNTCFDS